MRSTARDAARPSSRFRAAAIVNALLLAAAALGCAPSGPAPVALRLDPTADLGPTVPSLVGFNVNAGTPAMVGELRAGMVRIDGSLEQRFPVPGVTRLDPLVARVAEVRAIGAEPLVLLTSMPDWLQRDGTGPLAFLGVNGPRPARDLVVWQSLVEQLMERLATAAQPATWFEVWNEPDSPGFWGGTPEEFVQMAVVTHRAAAAVEARTGVDLHVGGPGNAFPDSTLLNAYLLGLRDAGLVPDFVSWHQYANSPFMGPDGNEGLVNEDLYQLLRGTNPFATPEAYGGPVARARALVEAVFPADADRIQLGVSEWNLAAGGMDLRHANHVGAAFVAGVLTVLEDQGLDFSIHYRGVGDPRAGDFGVVDLTGVRTPRWDVFAMFRDTAGRRLRITGADGDAGWWARATRTADGRTEIIVSAFAANPLAAVAREVTVEGLPGGATSAAAIDATDPSPHPVDVRRDGDRATFTLPSQSVVRLTVTPPR